MIKSQHLSHNYVSSMKRLSCLQFLELAEMDFRMFAFGPLSAIKFLLWTPLIYTSSTGMSAGIGVCKIHVPTVRGSAALCWPQTEIASFKNR